MKAQENRPAGVLSRVSVPALLLGLVLAACGAKTLPKNLSNADRYAQFRQSLAQGEKFIVLTDIQGTNVKHGKITGVVDAPIDTVWAVVTDFRNLPKIMPILENVQIAETRGRMVITDMRFGLTGVPIKYNVRLSFIHYPEAHRVEWTYIKGDVRDTYGSYVMRPFGADRTEVTLSLLMDLTGTAVGPFAQTGAGVVLPMMADNLRALVKDEKIRNSDLPLADYAKPDPKRLANPIDNRFAEFN